MSQRKQIIYRGGIVCFEIPQAWQEEYQQSGGGKFFLDEPDAGTLRLNVLSFDSEGREPSADMIRSLMVKDGYEALQDGLAIKRSSTSAEEGGEKLEMRSWQVAVPVPPYGARLAIFSYTYLASRAGDRATNQDVAMLERSISTAEYSREEGTAEEPAEPVFSPLTPDDLAMLDAEREFATSVLESRFPNSHLLGTPADLEVLQQIFDGGPYSDSPEGELVALGTTFGDLLARELELEWVNFTDSSGGDIGLRYRETSIMLFPRDMIIKRVERNEVVDLQHLYDAVVEQVQKMLDSGDYR